MIARRTQALWIRGPGQADLHDETIVAPGPGYALVEARFGAISRGTERLVLDGRVPRSEWARMRCPHQAGEFSFPVKYGYAIVGDVIEGRPELIGRSCFCLHPHQSLFVVPEHDLHPVPDDVPPERAVLAANMETALNALWDGGASAGQRIAVIGAGVIGLLVAMLATRLPGADVLVIDPNPARASIIGSMGASHAREPPEDYAADLVFHASGSPGGLTSALACAGFESTIVELSWYGDSLVEAPFGGAFHAKRLRVVSSQVGTVSALQRSRWSHARRLGKALALLKNPQIDALFSGEILFGDLASLYRTLLSEDGLCARIRYMPGT